ncbi:hypothetical protein COBT_004235, partial [Conglomerata obtusa]
MKSYEKRLRLIDTRINRSDYTLFFDFEPIDNSNTSTIGVTQKYLLFTPFKNALDLYIKLYKSNNNNETVKNNHDLILFIKKISNLKPNKKNKQDNKGLKVNDLSTNNAVDEFSVLDEKKENPGQDDLFIVLVIFGLFYIVFLVVVIMVIY